MAANQLVLEQGAGRNIQKKFCTANGAVKRVLSEHTLVDGVQKRILSYVPYYLFLSAKFDTAYLESFDKGGMKGLSWMWELSATAAYGDEITLKSSMYSLPEKGADLSCVNEIFIDGFLKPDGDTDYCLMQCFIGIGDNWVGIPHGKWIDLKKYPVKLLNARIRIDASFALFEPDKTEVCKGSICLNLRSIQTR